MRPKHSLPVITGAELTSRRTIPKFGTTMMNAVLTLTRVVILSIVEEA
jgi:hypothetical protein